MKWVRTTIPKTVISPTSEPSETGLREAHTAAQTAHVPVLDRENQSSAGGA